MKKQESRPEKITFDCPGCGRAILLEPQDMSLTLQCSACGTQFIPAKPAQVDAISKQWEGITAGPTGQSNGKEVTSSDPTPENVQLSPTYPWIAQLFGLIGSVMLVVGVFAPLLSMPIVGNMNYIQSGLGDGVIILLLAGISAFLAFLKWYRGLWATGLLSLALMTFTYTMLQTRVVKLGSEPVSPVIQMQWGWSLLGVGAILVVAAAILAEVRRRPEFGTMIKIFGCASIPVTIAMSGFLTLAVPFAFEWIGSEVASAQREAAEKTRREEEEKRKATQEEAERKSAQEAAEREAAKRQSLQDVTMQTLVPLPGQETILKTDKTPEWADATSYAVRQGNVIVSVTDLKQADYLQIQLSVKSIAKEPLLFRGWGTAEGNVPALLHDSSGRTLTAARERLPALAFSPRLVVPDQSITNWIAFDGSVRNLSSLRLELPASAFDGYGKLRIEIPKPMMVFKTAPSLGQKAVPLLTALLQDKDAKNRRGAAAVFADLGKDAATAVGDLANALQDSDEEVRLSAAKALTRIGPSSRNALKEILQALGDSNPKVCSTLEVALEDMSPFGKGDIPILLTCLKDPQVAVRAYVVNAFEKMPEQAVDAIPSLTESLRDSDAGVRGTAAIALGKIGPHAKGAISNLTQLLKDQDKTVRLNSIQSLAKMSKEPESKPALIEALKNDDDKVEEIAEAVLREKVRLTAEDIPGLLLVLKVGKTKARVFATSAIGRIGPEAKEAVPSLVEMLGDPEPSVRETAGYALGRIGSKAWKASPSLGKALFDKNPKVQLSAALALRDIGPDGRAAAQDLVASLKMKNLHDASTTALVKMGKAALPILLNSLENTKVYQERLDIISILGQIGPDASDAIPVLTTISNDSQLGGIRKAASNALEKIQAK